MKKSLLLQLTAISLQASAQKISISGYVKDAASIEALIGASVVNINTKSGASTNQYGFFSLSANAADTIDLFI
jgi:hypothetical protein